MGSSERDVTIGVVVLRQDDQIEETVLRSAQVLYDLALKEPMPGGAMLHDGFTTHEVRAQQMCLLIADLIDLRDDLRGDHRQAAVLKKYSLR